MRLDPRILTSASDGEGLASHSSRFKPRESPSTNWVSSLTGSRNGLNTHTQRYPSSLITEECYTELLY